MNGVLPSLQIPAIAELAKADRWVVWRPRQRNGKTTKVPFTPAGSPAKSTDHRTWSSYAECFQVAYVDGTAAGIGRVLCTDRDLIAFDLDGCIDKTGNIEPWARAIASRLNSYAEISPSGTGLRIFVRGSIPVDGRRKGKIECYRSKRYVTVTGNHVAGYPDTIETRLDAVAELYAELFGDDRYAGPKPPSGGVSECGPALDLPSDPPEPLEPSRLEALRANHADLFAREHPSQSERDFALASLVRRLGWPPIDAWRLIIAVRGDAKARRREYIERTLRRTYASPAVTASPGTAEEIGTSLDQTDLANARRLVRLATGRIIWAQGIGWLGWTGTHWREGDTAAVKLAARISRIVLEEVASITRRAALEQSEDRRKSLTMKAEQLLAWAKKSEARDRIAAALSLSRPWIEIETAKLDADPWLFNVQNGTIDLRTGELRDHRPGDYITRLAPVTYDLSATAPVWQAFLERILPSAELRGYVQRSAGYCLTGRVDEQLLFFAWGIGANGKSTFVACLRWVMGPYAVRAPSDLLIASKGERHSTEIMTLRGARLAICQEVEKGRQWAAQRLKELTGEEEVTARRLYRDFGTFELTAKLVVVGNYKPDVGDQSEAFWRRMRLIPFDVTIPADKRDPRLLDKLKAEGSGILNWMLEGARDWQEQGLGMPPEVVEAVSKYRKETDNIRGFVDECCVRDEHGRIKPGELFAAYKAWCKSANERAAGPADFKTALVDEGFQRVTVHGQAHWKGIAFKGGGWVVGGAETADSDKSPYARHNLEKIPSQTTTQPQPTTLTSGCETQELPQGALVGATCGQRIFGTAEIRAGRFHHPACLKRKR